MNTIVANMNKLLSNVTVLLLCFLFVSPSHTGTDTHTHTLFYCGQNFITPKCFQSLKKKKRKKVIYEKPCASLNLIPYSEQLSKLFSRFKKKSSMQKLVPISHPFKSNSSMIPWTLTTTEKLSPRMVRVRMAPLN